MTDEFKKYSVCLLNNINCLECAISNDIENTRCYEERVKNIIVNSGNHFTKRSKIRLIKSLLIDDKYKLSRDFIQSIFDEIKDRELKLVTVNEFLTNYKDKYLFVTKYSDGRIRCECISHIWDFGVIKNVENGKFIKRLEFEFQDGGFYCTNININQSMFNLQENDTEYTLSVYKIE